MSIRGLEKFPYRICFLAVKSKLHPTRTGERNASIILEGFPGIKPLGITSDASEAVRALSENGCKGLVLLVLSGGTENIILNIVSNYRRPTLLVGFGEHNSLAALVEAYSLLSTMDVQVYPLFLDINRLREKSQRTAIEETVLPLMSVIALRNARIGIIGKPSSWLVYAGRQAGDIKSVLHSNIINISLNMLYSEYEKADADPGEVEGLRSVSSSDLEVEGLRNVIRLYKAMRRLVEGLNLNAVTIECFKTIEDLGVSPCYALARLNSEGIDAGCEGDLPALVTMMVLHTISGTPAFMGNFAAIRDNSIILSHCTAPISIALNYMLTRHFETGVPAGVAARLPEGRVATIAKMDLSKRKLLYFKGKIKGSGLLSPKLCRTQALVEVGFDPQLLVEAGFGNHLVLVPGDYTRHLRVTAKLLRLEPVSPEA
ncbi:MAG: hypothetical protein LRS48_01175 [Desulfurococcales archaeon]|nr:hypothetical protein [Desulfurococcales archaeon]